MDLTPEEIDRIILEIGFVPDVHHVWTRDDYNRARKALRMAPIGDAEAVPDTLEKLGEELEKRDTTPRPAPAPAPIPPHRRPRRD